MALVKYYISYIVTSAGGGFFFPPFLGEDLNYTTHVGWLS